MNTKTSDSKISKTGIPNFVMSDDKFLMAVAPVMRIGNLCYVYSLICPRSGGNSFSLDPRVEIATFKDAENANIFYETSLRVAEYQDGPFKMVKDMFKERIDKFYQDVKQSHQPTR